MSESRIHRPPLFRGKADLLWRTVIFLTVVVYLAGLPIDIMEPDAAVYAQISMEMLDSGDFFSIRHKGVDWLDKPHFPFWITALSYAVFGVSTAAYKIPALLFTLIAAVYTWLFARRFYGTLHAALAVLVLMTAQHIIISNQDVRAEPFLTGLLIMGIYHLALFAGLAPGSVRYPWSHAVAGALAAACLIMTKGLFTVIPLVSGIGITLLWNGRGKELLHVKWLVLILLTAAFLAPAIYGYYMQFDRHPEKILFGRQGVSGVEFFLWASQWGRFTNTGPITGKGDPFFFVHTLIWAFLPWAFAAFLALWKKTKSIFSRRDPQEQITWFGFTLLFLIFSASKFQLSFYLNPLFPLLSILTVAVLLRQRIRVWKVFSRIHAAAAVLLLAATVALHLVSGFETPRPETIAFFALAGGLGLLIFVQKGIYLKKTFFGITLVCLAVNYYLHRTFYPGLLRYQAESQAAHDIRTMAIDPARYAAFGEMQSVGDIILHHRVPVFYADGNRDSLSTALTGRILFTGPEGKAWLDSAGMHYQILKTYPDFHVTRITGTFINAQSRTQALGQKYLLDVKGGR